MITTGTVRLDMSGEYWNYSTTLDESGILVDTFDYDRDVKFKLIGLENGAMDIYTREQLRVGAELRKARDAKGNAIFIDVHGFEYNMTVGSSVPIFSVFGVIEGYRAELRRAA